MFIKKDKFEAILNNMASMEKSMGIMAASIEHYPGLVDRRVNAYKTRQSQVAETANKYQGRSDYGNQLCQRIVDLRVAFSVPNRIFLMGNDKVKANKSEMKAAKEYLNSFLSLNGLDSSLPRDLSKESELEGQVLVQLVWDPNEKLPRIKYFPWKDTNYEIIAASEYLLTTKLKAKYTKNSVPKYIGDDVISFIAFHDRLNLYEGYPTCGPILKTLENLDKDLQDWRKLNFLFGHPTPHFKCETAEDAQAVNDMIRATGWHVGTAIATNSEFALKGPTGQESNMLMLSITTNAKVISGHTGIGIHFLGFANVMSNRATADSLGEPTEVILHSEIAAWTTFYRDLFRKAIMMRNANLNEPIKEDIVIPRLVPLTDRQWGVIKDVFKPLVDKKLVSHKTLLDNLPDVDADAEQERLDEEEKRAADKRAKDIEKFGNPAAQPGNEDNNQPPGNNPNNQNVQVR